MASLFTIPLPALYPVSVLQNFNWMRDCHSSNDKDVIAIDGKTLRHSYDKSRRKGAIHVISAFSTMHSLSLGQIKTDEKSNEITATSRQSLRRASTPSLKTMPTHSNLNPSASCHAGNFSRYSRNATIESSASMRVA